MRAWAMVMKVAMDIHGWNSIKHLLSLFRHAVSECMCTFII